MTMPNPFGLPEVAAYLATDTNGNPIVYAYPNGHLGLRGLFGGGTAPTLAAGAGAGSGASVGTQLGSDMAGSFVLTTAGTPAAGALATVTFAVALNAAPAAVLVTCWDQTASPQAAVAVGPTSITKTGFTVSGPTTTAAHNLLVNYLVILAQQ
jgi:hypothetical protein